MNKEFSRYHYHLERRKTEFGCNDHRFQKEITTLYNQISNDLVLQIQNLKIIKKQKELEKKQEPFFLPTYFLPNNCVNPYYLTNFFLSYEKGTLIVKKNLDVNKQFSFSAFDANLTEINNKINHLLKFQIKDKKKVFPITFVLIGIFIFSFCLLIIFLCLFVIKF